MPTMRHVPIASPSAISGQCDAETERRILAIAARARTAADAHMATEPGVTITSKRDELYQQAEAMKAAPKPKEEATMTQPTEPEQPKTRNRNGRPGPRYLYYYDQAEFALLSGLYHALIDIHRAAVDACRANGHPCPKDPSTLRHYWKSNAVAYPCLAKDQRARRAGESSRKASPRKGLLATTYPEYCRMLEAEIETDNHASLIDAHRACVAVCQANGWPHPVSHDPARWYCKSRGIAYPSMSRAKAIARGRRLKKAAQPADPGPVPGAAPAPGPATAPPPVTAVGTPADSLAWQQRAEKAETELAYARSAIYKKDDAYETLAQHAVDTESALHERIDKLIAGDLAWQQRAEKAEAKLAEAQATIETLHRNLASLNTAHSNAVSECEALRMACVAAASQSTIIRLRLPAPLRLVCSIGRIVACEEDVEESKATVIQRGSWLDFEVPQ